MVNRFRGKRIDGKWVFGNLLTYPSGNAAILIPDGSVLGEYVTVSPHTVGQDTGLAANDGTLVFVGDIVRLHLFTQENGGGGGICEGEKEVIAVIEQWQLGLAFRAKTESGYLSQYLECPSEELVEVLGNIHDNPELLEGM